MTVPVPWEYNPGARLLLLGEAPGETEVLRGRPFVGDSGALLDASLLRVGLQRKQFVVGNVCNYKPPGNKVAKALPEHMAEGKAQLAAFLERERPLAILAVGNTALEALTGQRGITARRGSLHRTPDGIPVWPTLHPAAVLRSPADTVLFIHDLRRFGRLVRDELPEPPVRTLITDPTDDDIERLLREMTASPATACDIEAEDKMLACVGFAPRPDFAVCIPNNTAARHAAIRRVLAAGHRLIFHNAPYDVPFLVHRCGFAIPGPIEDTLAQHQALHPEMPRDLATLTSLYTYQPYYKDMYVEWENNEDHAVLYHYNTLDCCVTREIWEVLNRLLDTSGCAGVYARTRDVLRHAIEMSLVGMPYDTAEARRLVVLTQEEIVPLQQELDALAGEPLNTFSPKKVSNFLYKKLKLPAQVNRETGQLVTNEKVLMSVYARTPDPETRRALQLLFDIRHRRRFISSYLKAKPSSDGCMRTSFNPAGTETGRWSASKFLITEGANLQTVGPKWKSCFPAPDGMVLWFADYSQIEARFVAWLARDEDQIAFFKSGGDIHKLNASRIYNKAVEDVTPHERQVAKSCVHALNYGVGPKTLMDTVNKKGLETGFWLALEMAKKVRAVYMERFSAVVRWQEDTWATVRRDRRLTNQFGRTRIFLGSTDAGRLAESEHTKKEGLAFVPQSDVPDMMNIAIQTIRNDPMRVEDRLVLALQIHDALGGWGPANTVHEWAPRVVAAMDIPVLFPFGECRVPVELKIGPRWSQLEKIEV